MSEIAIGGIWLRYVGGENDPLARVIVEVKVSGEWLPVINEAHASAFSHSVTAAGIQAALPMPEERAAETARRRSEGAKTGWEIRRNKGGVPR